MLVEKEGRKIWRVGGVVNTLSKATSDDPMESNQVLAYLLFANRRSQTRLHNWVTKMNCNAVRSVLGAVIDAG